MNMPVLVSTLVGTSGLSLVLIIAIVLTLRRPRFDPASHRVVTQFVVAAIVLQFVHFLEETYTGFYIAFPTLIGLTPWPGPFFVSFNLLWIVIWLICAVFIGRHPWLLAPVWFLAIAAMANGVIHPILSIVTSGYFPGLVSSPFLGILGILLFRKLIAATDGVSHD